MPSKVDSDDSCAACTCSTCWDCTLLIFASMFASRAWSADSAATPPASRTASTVALRVAATACREEKVLGL
eukprot:CAMPEP_0175003794 /NCGR_PEP_ID=MMETSP0005-20121125/4418_1 /TAXON_ID=420556 /ORGANISM="Ochromonas sp., Strain CCMP1393" /LENGTH=70 /DNA_ID=CAMNT_0016258893 /DNA_START=36 /DNA_END=248 /DNA_ORIENTATION=+